MPGMPPNLYLRVRKRKKPELKPFVQEAINRGDRFELRKVLESEGSIEVALAVLNEHVDAAVERVRNVFDNDASVQLCALANQLK